MKLVAVNWRRVKNEKVLAHLHHEAGDWILRIQELEQAIKKTRQKYTPTTLISEWRSEIRALADIPIPFRLARFSMAPVGSDPMERKHISGTRGLLSSQVASRFRITPSAYLSPMVSAMYFRAWCNVRSGHHDLV